MDDNRDVRGDVEPNADEEKRRSKAAALVDRILCLPTGRGNETILDETRRKALYYARKKQVNDPENAASDAVCHFCARLEVYGWSFEQLDGTLNLAQIRGWRKTVLFRHVAGISRRQRKEKWVLPFDESWITVVDEQPPAHERIDDMLIQAEELLRLLVLALRRNEKERQLLLAHWAGFSPLQLTRVLPYTVAAQPVIVCRFLASVRRNEKHGQRRIRCFEAPEGDVPLATRATPKLVEAFKAIRGEKGDALLQALWQLMEDPRIRFLSRMAGFWDCVIASAFDEKIDAQRNAILHARGELEAMLADTGRETDRSGADGLGGSAGEGPAGEEPRWSGTSEGGAVYGERTEGSGSHGPYGDPPFKQAQGAIDAMKKYRDELDTNIKQHLLELDRLAEVSPDKALALLLDSPFVHDGLARGRAIALEAALASERSATPALPAWLEALRIHVKERFSGARTWIRLPALTPQLAYRRKPQTAASKRTAHATSRYQPLVLAGDRERFGHFHCIVWQLETPDGGPRLVYPRDSWDPTLGREIRNHQGVVQCPEGGGTVRLMLFWSREPIPSDLARNIRSREREILEWVRQQIERQAGPDLPLHSIVLEVGEEASLRDLE